jgi:hypothetical protein
MVVSLAMAIASAARSIADQKFASSPAGPGKGVR